MNPKHGLVCCTVTLFGLLAMLSLTSCSLTHRGVSDDDLPSPFDVTISRGPAELSRLPATDVEFAFFTSESAVIYCALDDGNAQQCYSPVAYENLDDGPHRFVVSAKAGEAFASDQRTFFVSPRDDRAAPLTGSDIDQDGVLDAKDACNRTSPQTRVVAMGCSAVEIAANPALLLEMTIDKINAAMAALDDPRLFGERGHSVVNDLRARQRLLERGVDLIASGQICAGSEELMNGSRQMQQDSKRLFGLVSHLRQDLDHEVMARKVSPEEADADDLEIRYHELSIRLQAHEDAVRSAAESAVGAAALCDQVDGVESITGVVAETFDDLGVVRLQDGRLIAVSNTGRIEGLNEGVAIEAKTSKFKDGSAQAMQSGSTDIQGNVVPQVSLPCMFLRIAPLQRFLPPVQPDSIVLHRPEAYEVDGTLELEEFSRIGAVLGSCPKTVSTTGPVGAAGTYRYSLKVDYTPDGGVLDPMADDLTEGERPVPFPLRNLSALVNGTLSVTVQVQTCLGLTCTLASPMRTDNYDVRHHPVGSLAELRYNSALLSLDEWDPADSEVIFVSSAILKAPVATGGLPEFKAEGFSPLGDGTIAQVSFANPYFTVYTVDPVNPSVFAYDLYGTNQKSGLQWPRAVGNRNGQEFWYTTKLPVLVRDVLTSCPSDHFSMYRYPWDADLVRTVGQGNFGAVSHFGSQAFAFDFDFTEGDTIRAARGGEVEWFDESLTGNIVPTPNDPPGNQNWGNAVRIRHDDGSSSWYFHIQTDGVSVRVGDEVQRGQPIALSGNTGRSGRPHLHYQAQATSVDWAQSMRISFEGCEIPGAGDDVTSNNLNPNFP